MSRISSTCTGLILWEGKPYRCKEQREAIIIYLLVIEVRLKTWYSLVCTYLQSERKNDLLAFMDEESRYFQSLKDRNDC